MSEWYEELEQKYIHLFETFEDGKVIRGIEVGKGWKEITEEFLESLEWIRTHNLHMNNGNEHTIKIFQIKQKFGSFTAYVGYGDSEGISHQIEKVIGRAEGKAQLTCENCGTVEKIIPTTGWISILCQKCKNNKGK